LLFGGKDTQMSGADIDDNHFEIITFDELKSKEHVISSKFFD
jgi:hypothetical protein